MTSESLGPIFEMICHDGKLATAQMNLTPGSDVLDVGTGNGYFATFLALNGHRVTTGEPADDDTHYAGLDWFETASKVGVADKITFKAFDAAAMPFAAEQFEAVCFFGVLHHIPEQFRAQVVSEALRVCRQGGSVAFFEPLPKTLEMAWKTDPDHPPAAVPASYLADARVQCTSVIGKLMEITLFKPAACP
ncbi:MAG: class I SAM-dependent methyltransferase [Cellvibrionaceae bacterium]|nr:class I SAM-dependent methyltransferase [Cellvibrionaceae bacterium]